MSRDDVVAHLLRRAHRKSLGADDRQGERVQGGERRADRGRGAAAGRQVRGIHAVAGKEVDDDGAGVAEARLAEQFGRAEGQQTAHAGGQCAQRARLGGEFGRGVRRRPGTRTTTRRPSSSSATAAS